MRRFSKLVKQHSIKVVPATVLILAMTCGFSSLQDLLNKPVCYRYGVPHPKADGSAGCEIPTAELWGTGLFQQALHAEEPATASTDSLEGCRELDVPYSSLAPDSNFRDLVNDAFGIGEYLKFELGYGFLKAGCAEMQVDSLFEHNGRTCYMITTRARSYKFFDTFYKVRDEGQSWVDAWGLFPWRFEKHLREGSYEADVKQVFDQYRGLAFEEDDTIMVDRYIQDVLSSLYYVRTLDLKVGDTIFIDNYNKKQCYDLDVIVHGREEVKVKAGKFSCLKVEPLLRSAGLFKHEGRLTVFMTDDRLKMPVLMKSKVVVGSITAELMEFRLGELID